MNDFNGLLQLLLEARARTVSGAFERFLDKEINIAKGIRGLASTSQNHLRDFLATERQRDVTFPRVLSIIFPWTVMACSICRTGFAFRIQSSPTAF